MLNKYQIQFLNYSHKINSVGKILEGLWKKKLTLPMSNTVYFMKYCESYTGHPTGHAYAYNLNLSHTNENYSSKTGWRSAQTSRIGTRGCRCVKCVPQCREQKRRQCLARFETRRDIRTWRNPLFETCCTHEMYYLYAVTHNRKRMSV